MTKSVSGSAPAPYPQKAHDKTSQAGAPIPERRFAPIAGTLTTRDGRERCVELELTTVEETVDQPLAAQPIRLVRLLSKNVPDGEYLLAYSYFKPYTHRVRLRSGVLEMD